MRTIHKTYFLFLISFRILLSQEVIPGEIILDDGQASHDGVVSGLIQDTQVGRYRLYENEFVSSTTHNNPFLDVQFSVTVNGPHGESFEIDGYWQEQDKWRIRIMPFSLGSWTYETHSNESSLDGITGSFDCVLSNHPGILRVNPDRPYTFMLSGGNPFFWMGETCWLLLRNNVKFSDGSFQTYVLRRREQKFNKINFLFGLGANVENEGGKMWTSKPQEKINPDFFSWVDRRLAYLDSLHMVAGLFIAWSQDFASHTKQEYERFERYLIARYGAYPMLYWVVAGEFDEAGTISNYKYHAQVIENKDPYDHPISIHPDQSDPQNIGSNRIFRNENWLGFLMHQYPSFAQGSYTTSDVHAFTLADRHYGKPVVNEEFYYEAHNYNGEVIQSSKIRRISWGVVMGGGFPTYGHHNTIFADDLSDTESAGARYMTRLYDFFENLEWWKFYPENGRVNSGFSMSRSNGECIVYLPWGGSVRVDLGGYTGIFNAQWYDPKNGDRVDAATASGGGNPQYMPPFSGDAVLRVWPKTDPGPEPSIALSGDSLFFTGTAGQGLLNPQSITVTNSGEGTLSWTAHEEPNSHWIILLNSSGVSGDKVKVVVNTLGLEEGFYGNAVLVHDPAALNSPQTFWVTATIIPPAKGVLHIDPDTLEYSAYEVDQNPSSQFLKVINDGGQALTWAATEFPDRSWFSLNNTTGTDGDSVEVMVEISSLDAGSYNGIVRFTDSEASNSPIDVGISLTILPSVPILNVEPAELDFDSSATMMTLWVKNIGRDTLSWSIIANPPQFWITDFVPDSGTVSMADSQEVVVTIDRSMMIPGDYAGVITVLSNGGSENMILRAVATGSPTLSVSSVTLNFYMSLDSLTLKVLNTGDGLLQWNLNTNPTIDWIWATPATGMIPSSSYQQVGVSIDRSGLGDGSYSSILHLTSNDENFDIPVSLVVSQSPIYSQWVNCGSSISYMDKGGREWVADQLYSQPGWGYTNGFASSTSDSIGNTVDDPIFRSQRWSMDGYTFDCYNGMYELTLRFAETTLQGEGKRVFHVIAEDMAILHDLDITKQSGGMNSALQTLFMVEVIDSQLNIEFEKVVDNPTIAGIGVLKGPEDTTWVNPESSAADDLPTQIVLFPNYPNPFNMATQWIFEHPVQAHVQFMIYNTRGQRIRKLMDQTLAAGRFEMSWNGTDDRGQSVESGIYLGVLRVGEVVRMLKMTLLK